MKLTATFPTARRRRCSGSRTGTSRGRSDTASRISSRCRRARGSTRRSATTTPRRNKRNPSRPPVRVTWGEESNDEMGSIGLQVVAANRGELPQLQRAFNEHLRTAATTRRA